MSLPVASLRAASGPADEAIARGIELRRAARDTEALDQFKKAYDLSPSPRALTQMGWAEQALGRWADAEAHLRDALKSKSDPWIRKARPTIDSSLAAVGAHLGSLEVTGTPEGAEVDVDGKRAGTLPLSAPVRVPAGDVVLEVRLANHRAISRTVNVRAGELARETVSLVPVMAEPPAAGAAVSAPKASGEVDSAPAAAAATGSSTSEATGTPAPGNGAADGPAGSAGAETGSWRGPAKWIVGGVAVLALGAGITGLVEREQKVSAFDSKTAPGSTVKVCSNGPTGVMGGSDCVSLAHDADFWRNVAIAGFVGAGVFGVGALVLHLMDDRAPTAASSRDSSVATRRAGLSCDLNPLAWGAMCRVRF